MRFAPAMLVPRLPPSSSRRLPRKSMATRPPDWDATPCVGGARRRVEGARRPPALKDRLVGAAGGRDDEARSAGVGRTHAACRGDRHVLLELSAAQPRRWHDGPARPSACSRARRHPHRRVQAFVIPTPNPPSPHSARLPPLPPRSVSVARRTTWFGCSRHRRSRGSTPCVRQHHGQPAGAESERRARLDREPATASLACTALPTPTTMPLPISRCWERIPHPRQPDLS